MIPTAVAVGAILGWLSFEVVFRRPGDASKITGSPSDRLTTPLLIVGYACAAILPILFRTRPTGREEAITWVGVALAVGGLGIRAWGMRTLGDAYTRSLRTAADQALVTSGPYGYVRHPGYLGSILVWCGAALAFGSWPTGVLVAAVLIPAYAWRIRSEETMLDGRFGDMWRRYARRTARLLPYIW